MRTLMISRVAALTAAAATVVAVTTVASPATASATRASRTQVWRQVTPNGSMSNSSDVGLAAGAGGTLNVIWAAGGTSGGQAKIMDTPVSYAGAVGRAATIVSAGYQFSDPDATVTGNKIDAVWNGVINPPTGPDGAFIASRAIGGGSWSVPSVTPPQPPAPDTSLSDTAATGSDGKPWVAWTGTGTTTVVHVGHPEQQATGSGCCAYYPGLAVDGRSGKAWLGYMSLITGHVGVYLQGLKQDGTHAGKAQRLPGTVSGGSTVPLNARIALTGRGHGRSGVYVAYLAGSSWAGKVDLLKAGTTKAVKLASTTLAHQFACVAVTANSAGGLWLAWTNGDGSKPGLTVRESNKTVSKFGKAMRVALPSGTLTIWKVYVKAVKSRLDVVALLTRHGKIAYYFTQVR